MFYILLPSYIAISLDILKIKKWLITPNPTRELEWIVDLFDELIGLDILSVHERRTYIIISSPEVEGCVSIHGRGIYFAVSIPQGVLTSGTKCKQGGHYHGRLPSVSLVSWPL